MLVVQQRTLCNVSIYLVDCVRHRWVSLARCFPARWDLPYLPRGRAYLPRHFCWGLCHHKVTHTPQLGTRVHAYRSSAPRVDAYDRCRDCGEM